MLAFCSFHEMGIYDLKAEFKLITKVTGKRSRYIGHSMGTTAAYVYSITYPEESTKLVDYMIHICPIAYFKHLKSSITLAAPLAPILLVIKKQIFWDKPYSINTIFF